MRVNRLDLTRYGRFTDARLDFGPKPASGPDLHVVYGPNEAGKSTVFAALLDFFYGIEARSPYNFLHPYPQMRIGASLLLDGRERTYARIKRQQNNLLDESGHPVAETALQAALGGVTREACRVMFSLDDRTLEEGGESILASKGDLGQLLFSASAGLADLSRRLETIEAELDAFHTPRAQKSRLADLKRRLGDLGEERRTVDVQAGAYAAMAEAGKSAEAAYAEARERLAAAQARRSVVAALLKALPLTLERAALLIDDRALALEPSIAALRDAAAEYRKSAADLPNRHAECAEADQEVAAVLRRLGRPAEEYPQRLVIAADQVAVLRELAARSGALEATLAAAVESAGEAEAALTAAQSGPGGDALDTEAVDRLAAALAECRAERSTGQYVKAKARLGDASDRLVEALRALNPWAGEAEALAALAAPAAADLAAAAAAIADAQKALALREAAIERSESELVRHRAVLAALGGLESLSVGADHAAVRAERDRSWSAHRKQLDAASADAF
ncbi:MAG: AAA family ATPase, partial [Beijerinckiaceae bacterium]